MSRCFFELHSYVTYTNEVSENRFFVPCHTLLPKSLSYVDKIVVLGVFYMICNTFPKIFIYHVL
jgi:hypothetical protein